MARPLLPDAPWAASGRVRPPHPPRPRGGRPPLAHRPASTGILFVLKTGIPWEDLPAEMGCGSGMSCWRRLERWQRDGTWGRRHAALPERLHQAGRIDGRPSTRPACGPLWGAKTGPSPTDRGKRGSKHHLMVDAAGVPLAATVSAANAHGVTGLLPTGAACPLPGHGSPGRTPRQLLGDRADRPGGHDGVRRRRGIRPRFARPGVAHGSGLGRQRYVVEQAIAAVHQNRRLKVRSERRPDLRQAFLTLACVKVCWYPLAGRFR